jgi:drug/metabolite transporter (DMT)-like permease
MQLSRTLPARTGFWQSNQALLSEMVFVLVVAVWGISFIFTKSALEVIGPFAYNTLRMTLGAVTLAALVGRDWRKIDRQYLWPALVTGLILFLSYASQATGQQYTTASKAGFLTGTNVVYVPILSALLLRRAPSRTAIAGVVMAFLGLILLSFEPGSLSFAPGDIWVALSGLGWALYIIALAHYSPRLNVVAYASLHVFVAAAISGFCWLLFEPWVVPVTSSALWVGVITTGVLIIGLGTSVQTWVTRTASPTRVALIAALEPVFAAVGGWWIREPLTWQIIAGGSVILMGMLTAELGHLLRGQRNRKRPNLGLKKPKQALDSG